MKLLEFWERHFQIFRAHLLNPRLDDYVIYAILLGVFWLILLGFCLAFKKERLILPGFLLALLLVPGFFYLREFSPWSSHLQTAPAPVPAPDSFLPKLGEAGQDGLVDVVPPAEPPPP